jgi:TonB-dependent starch-binding outer membrane protein SusC
MKLIKYLLPLLITALSTSAQKNRVLQRITGKVISASGIPVMSASISFQKQRHSVISNQEGNFSIQYNGLPDTLIISHVSYKTTLIGIDSKTPLPLMIQLEEASKHLQDVVINTGFQELPKERATGSFSFINNKTLNLQTGTNILDRLKGVSSSLLFDDTKNKTDNRKLNINIRGLSTINGSQDPLVVVDNFPYDGDLNNINPDDIESVTILKDAAAASIWGTKAGNGVIVITTKKAKFNQPLKIELNADVMITDKPDLFAIPQMNIGDFIDVEQTLFNKGFFNRQINSSSMPALPPAVEIFLKRKNGQISGEDSANAINILKTQDVRKDYSEYMYRKAVTQVYSLQLNGGSGQYKYIISGGYNRNIGNLSDKNERMNIRIDNSLKVSKKLQLNVAGMFTNLKSISGKSGYSGKGFLIGSRNVPYASFVDKDGKAIPVERNYRQSYIDTAGGGKLLDWNYYPLTDDSHNMATSNSNSFLANIGLQYQVINSLSLNLMYQYESQQSQSQTLSDEQSYSTRNMINTFSQIDPATGIVNYSVPLGSILYRTGNSLESQNFRGQLNFSKSWHEQSIVAIIGSEIRQAKTSGDGYNAYGYNSDLLTYSNVDFVNPYPTYVTGYPQYIPNNMSFSGTLNRFVSLFGNAAYTLKERYTLSASFRKDASNVFGVNANDKWLPFWSAGIGWDLSKENFYKLLFLPYLKLRATYGYSGIVDQSKSAVTVMGYFGANNNYTGTPQGMITQFANNNLSWEKVKQFNIGLDFQSKNEVIQGSADYYIKNGFDLFGLSPIDYTAGLSTDVLTKNIANMNSKGIDVVIQSTNINGKFKWLTNWLLNYNMSKTTSYYTATGQRFLAESGTDISPLVGKPLYAVLSYKSGSLDKSGNPQGYYNKGLSTDYLAIFNSLTNPDSLVYDGPAVPKYFGSIGNAFLWKGFSVSVNINYKLGYFFRRSTISYDQLINFGIGNADYSKRWQKPGDELITTIPSFIYPINSNAKRRDQFYAGSEATVLRGDQVRLQFINLTYDFTKLLLKSTSIKSLQLYVVANNLGLLWRANKEGIDPDFPSTWPTPKTYAIGIKASF